MLPNGFLLRMEQQLQDEFPDYLTSLDRPRAVGLRLNPLKTDHFPDLPFSLTPCALGAVWLLLRPPDPPGAASVARGRAVLFAGGQRHGTCDPSGSPAR